MQTTWYKKKDRTVCNLLGITLGKCRAMKKWTLHTWVGLNLGNFGCQLPITSSIPGCTPPPLSPHIKMEGHPKTIFHPFDFLSCDHIPTHPPPLHGFLQDWTGSIRMAGLCARLVSSRAAGWTRPPRTQNYRGAETQPAPFSHGSKSRIQFAPPKIQGETPRKSVKKTPFWLLLNPFPKIFDPSNQ